jgi:hypothetical protein
MNSHNFKTSHWISFVFESDTKLIVKWASGLIQIHREFDGEHRILPPNKLSTLPSSQETYAERVINASAESGDRLKNGCFPRIVGTDEDV